MKPTHPGHRRRPLLLDCVIALTLLLAPSGARVRADTSPSIATGIVIVTEERDSLARVAARYGTSLQAIVEANGLSPREKLPEGLGLVIPRTEALRAWPHPIRDIRFSPNLVTQGQTVAILLNSEQPVTATARFDDPEFVDISVPFSTPGQHLWGLIPINVLAKAGRHWLRLQMESDREITVLALALDVQEARFGRQTLWLPASKNELLEDTWIADENKRLRPIWKAASTEQFWQSNFRLPVEGRPKVNTPFGIQVSINGRPSLYHEGLDLWLPTDIGTPIYAAARGRVILAEPLKVRGNGVIIDHGMGLKTGYWHLSEIDVQPGQMMDSGDLIGRMGTTGLSTGTHLHWETRVGNIPVNPMQWLDTGWLVGTERNS